jgi:hypothetical protein
MFAQRLPHALGRWIAASLCMALTGSTSAGADDPEEWDREAGPDVFFVTPTNVDGVPTHLVLRVVDDLTDEPIAGASVSLREEMDNPTTGFVPAVRTGIADEDGWVRVRADDLGWLPSWESVEWAYVEAPGHAGAAVAPGAWVEREVRLGRAYDVPVQVRDALDRPVSGAVVGVRVSSSCGHMPDQRVAKTGTDGIAVLPSLGLDGSSRNSCGWECWVAHPSLEGDYHQIDVSPRSKPPRILCEDPSQPIEGTILDVEGKPVVAADVGTVALHRGPWTRTDSEGHFRLEGARELCEVLVETPEGPSGKETPRFTAPPAGFRRTFRLPAEGAKPPVPAERRVHLVVRDGGTQEEIEGYLPLVAVRESDGLTEDGAVHGIVSLAPGSWTILAGGGSSTWALGRARLDVPEDEDGPQARAEIVLLPLPRVRVEYSGGPEKSVVQVVTATSVRSVAEKELSTGLVAVPEKDACAFRVMYWGSEEEPKFLHTPIPPPPRGPGTAPIRIRAPANVVLHARLVGPDGRPVPGWLSGDLSRLVDFHSYSEWDPEVSATNTPQVALLGEGKVEVLAIPEGRALAPRIVQVTLPPDSIEGGEIDLGIVRLEQRGDPRLTVVLADGKPTADARIRIEHAGVVRDWPRTESEVCDPLILPLQAGDLVIVDAPWEPHKAYARPVRRRLEGKGPWEIRNDLPDTSILVDPRDESGKSISALLVVDGRPHDAIKESDDTGKEFPFELAGLEPGPHRVALAAENRITHEWRVVLKRGEHRTIPGVLRTRPKDRAQTPR